jgi:hypothetical protein
MERGTFYHRVAAGVDLIACHPLDWMAVAMQLEDVEDWTITMLPSVVLCVRPHHVSVAIQHRTSLVNRVLSNGFLGRGLN